jgi:Fur family transcriptional regulator, ferric uptake regulator
VTEVHRRVETRLHAVGQRYTSKRRALVEALRRAGNPIAITDLTDGRRGLPQSSVYRNLAVLEQAGVVHRVVTGEEFARYELAEDLTEHHHHLMCKSCGRVEDITVPVGLERSMTRTVSAVAGRAGFSGVSHQLDLIGTCRSCGQNER